MRIQRKVLWSLVVCLAATSLSERVGAQARQVFTVQRVLLLSIDGFHALDLANFIKAKPNSTLAQLSRMGVTYSNASTSMPSDSFPGLLAQVTGGSPVSTGVWYDDSYDRNLSPPITFGGDKSCSKVGTEVLYDESIDINKDDLFGGGGINTDALPRNPSNGCQPVFPHSYLRVNTIFEVAHQAGKRTAWSDKHFAYDVVNGPSGVGVDDLFTPEIAANGDATKHLATTEANDDLKVQAILNEIDGKDHTGTNAVGVPAIFGMNFQAVSVGQKLASDLLGAGGYLDVNGTPGPVLTDALNHTDASIGMMVSELQKQGLLDSTLIIISAKHGQSPIDKNKRQGLDDGPYDTLLGSLEAMKTTDDVALIWLSDQTQTADAVSTLSQPANEATLGIEEIFSGESLKLRFNDPLQDSRTPNIVVKTNYGVIYTGGTKIAEHGGFGEDDTHVALLVANPSFSPRQLKIHATTMQIAPTILRALGLNPQDLQAVQIEKTPVLPGLFHEFKGHLRTLSVQ